jgi:hypothetical protein
MRYPAGFISAFYNPLQNPDAPTIGTATAGISSLSVTFTAPANVGGSAITGFIATARKTSDGTTVSATGASSPISITGLTEDAFTVTVAAVNTYGPSASSAASNSVTPLPAIGGAFGGGFFAGQISTAGNSIADYNLVVGPVASAQDSSIQYKNAASSTAGTSSVIDGPANTAAMNNANHLAAQFCEGLTIGGFSDWYMPAKNELEVCYFNLKPTTESNKTTVPLSGANTNAVPSRGSNYTAGTPAQTTATSFKDTGAEDFAEFYYWSSTENSASDAWVQKFTDGFQYGGYKKNLGHVRAIRRVAV